MAGVSLSSEDDDLNDCLGQSLEELWPSRLAAGIMRRDEEAVEVFNKRARRGSDGRLAERCHWLAERIYLAKGDRESSIYRQIDFMHEELRKLRATASGVPAVPLPEFKTGQSVLQWWSPWMKDARETPKTYNKKSRLAWFSAEITIYKTYETMRYAGQESTGHTYNV